MIKLIIKLLIIALVFVLLDRLIGNTLIKSAQKKVSDKRIEKILQKKIDHDVLVFGSSRAARNLIPTEITKTSGFTAFNLGFTGSNIDFHVDLLKLVIDSGHKPKIIILAVDDSFELWKRDGLSFRSDVLYPYLYLDKIRRIISQRGELDPVLSKYVMTYTQSKNIRTLLSPNTINKFDKIQDDGSMPLDFKSTKYASMTFNNVTSYDTNKESKALVKKLSEFTALCQLHKIKLFVLFPPNFKKPSNHFINRIKQVGGKYPFYIDYSTFITDKNKYYDDIHLDHNGATILSREIGETIKDTLTYRQYNWSR